MAKLQTSKRPPSAVRVKAAVADYLATRPLAREAVAVNLPAAPAAPEVAEVGIPADEAAAAIKAALEVRRAKLAHASRPKSLEETS